MVAPTGRVAIVTVPMCNFLMVDGQGDAGSPSLGAAIRAVTDLSAAVRLYLQEDGGELLDPMPVEILWSPPDDEVWREAAPQEWSWTVMVAQPSRVTPEFVAAVRERLPAEQNDRVLRRIHLGSLREGLCAQTTHATHAESSRGVLERLVDHVRAMGYEPHGPHHEIHLADLRHQDAAPLRTIVRQPIRLLG